MKTSLSKEIKKAAMQLIASSQKFVCIQDGLIETVTGEARSAEVKEGDILTVLANRPFGFECTIQLKSGLGFSHHPGLSGKQTDPNAKVEPFTVGLRTKNINGNDDFFAQFEEIKTANKTAAANDKADANDIIENVENESTVKILQKYKPILMKLVGSKSGEAKVEAINKLKIVFDNKRLRKPDRYWFQLMDKGVGAGNVGDLAAWIKQLNFIFSNKLPTARIVRIVLDYGLEHGIQALKRVLENKRARTVFLNEENLENQRIKEEKKES